MPTPPKHPRSTQLESPTPTHRFRDSVWNFLKSFLVAVTVFTGTAFFAVFTWIAVEYTGGSTEYYLITVLLCATILLPTAILFYISAHYLSL
jgi:hypothetical protein